MAKKARNRNAASGIPVPSHLRDWLGPLDWFEDDPYIEGDLVCPCGRKELVFCYPGQTHHVPAAFALATVLLANGQTKNKTISIIIMKFMKFINNETFPIYYW